MLTNSLSHMIVASAALQQGTSRLVSFAGYMTEHGLHLVDPLDDNTCCPFQVFQGEEFQTSLYHVWIGRYVEAWAPKSSERLEIFRLYVEESLEPFPLPAVGQHPILCGRRGIMDRRVSFDHLYGDFLMEMSIPTLQKTLAQNIVTERSPSPLRPSPYISSCWIPHPLIFPDYSLGGLERPSSPCSNLVQ